MRFFEGTILLEKLSFAYFIFPLSFLHTHSLVTDAVILSSDRVVK